MADTPKLLIGIYSFSLIIFSLAITAPNKATKASVLLKKICLSKFNSTMNQEKKSAPEGMASFTCKCFVFQIKEGATINSAKKTCQKKASSEFTLI